MDKNKRLQRIAQECALCALYFSNTKQASYDDEEGSWVVVHNFQLPKGYNYITTDILVLLPPQYPLTPPDWFYVDHNLRLESGDKPAHIFHETNSHDPNRPQNGQEPPYKLGWTACCLHIRTWKPTNDPLTGHSLLSVFELIKGALGRWKR